MTSFEIPMRWADLDSYNHVNNVRYVDFADEARLQLIDDGTLRERAATSVDVEFLRPLLFTRVPIRVTSEMRDETLVQEIFDGTDERPHARVTSEYGTPAEPEPNGADVGLFHCHVRRRDLGADGWVTTAKVFEHVQESRIKHFSDILRDGRDGGFVVARVSVVLHRPVGWRSTPYPISSWVKHVGTSSLILASNVEDGIGVCASSVAVLVGFDLKTHTSRKLTDKELSRLHEVFDAN